MKKAGILLHISSLPSPFGIGTLGKNAYQFINFMQKSGQTYWQVLPLNPTLIANSPYQSSSIYAGNPLFIDPLIVKEKGLIENIDYLYTNDNNKIHYQKVIKNNELFINKIKIIKNNDYYKFIHNNFWVFDYALYSVLKKINKLKPWYMWDDYYRNREEKALNYFIIKHKEQIEHEIFIQYLFFQQWYNLKKYANLHGIKIIGDIPIYVAYDSVEVWVNPQNFQLNESKRPTKIAGVPPDYFSKKGQLWGNPLYDWEYLKIANYKWWLQRVKFAMDMYDIIRIDHFRGFSQYYAIPYGSKDAVKGKWEDGPGIDLFKIIKQNFNDDRIIAEDLGHYDRKLRRLLNYTNYSGMKVLQFLLQNPNMLHELKKIKSSTILYTGTHDNDTLVGWFSKLTLKQKKAILAILHTNNYRDINWHLINLAYKSPAKIVVVPFQDFLGLDSEDRMNIPGKLNGNWEYRVQMNEFTPSLASKIFNYVINSNRI